MKLINLTNHRFGKLLVLERAANKGKKVVWKCLCDCGNITEVRTTDLRTGNTKSCGCLGIVPKDLKHGHSYEPIYRVWKNMKSRCFNKNTKSYKDYGQRGITVCEEWKKDFNKFYEYVSKLPHFNEKGYSIDRINNNGNYEPSNIRWATNKEQVNNRRNRK